jgi:hypothetical protein
MSTHGNLLQHGKPQRWEARSQPDAREGQAGPPGVADGFVVPGKPGNSGGGKGPEFKEAGRRGKRTGRVAKAYSPPHERSRSEGIGPHGEISRSRRVLPCPRAGCGKSARPGSTSGEWKRSFEPPRHSSTLLLRNTPGVQRFFGCGAATGQMGQACEGCHCPARCSGRKRGRCKRFKHASWREQGG